MTSKQNLERNSKILKERSRGRTLADIGKEFGICSESVRRCAFFAEKHNKDTASPIWYARLSTRAQNVLLHYKLTDKDDALLAFSSGKNLMFKNSGIVTSSEIKSALGLT
jgi:hypothetical protein